MPAEIGRLDMMFAAHWLFSQAAGNNKLINRRAEQKTLPAFAQKKLEAYRDNHKGTRMDVDLATMMATSGLDVRDSWDRVMGKGDSRHSITPEEIARIRDPEFRAFTGKLYEIAASVKEAYSPGALASLGDKAEAKKEDFLSDGVLDKKEARKLRKLVRAEFNASQAPEQVADAFVAALVEMRPQVDNAKTDHYVGTVVHEFKERATYQRAAYALGDYLTEHRSELSRILKHVDTNVSDWQVDSNMNRGVYLQVPIKPIEGEYDYYSITDEIEALFATVPELRKFGGISVGMRWAE